MAGPEGQGGEQPLLDTLRFEGWAAGAGGEDMPPESQQCHASFPHPGLPALIVIGTGSANSYGLYTIQDKENRTTLEL